MKPGMGWPIGVAAILTTTVVANLLVMRIANNDPSFSIEPDYYRKAVFFDSTMAQTHRNVDLGWAVDASFDRVSAGRPTRVRVLLRDRTAQPIAGAVVEATVLFNARANDRTTSSLHDEGNGEYTAFMPVNVPGEWEVRVTAHRDGAHFTSSTRVNALRAAAGAVSGAVSGAVAGAMAGATR